MKTIKLILILFFVAAIGQSQLTPWQAVELMKRGINIGNSLEATGGSTSDQAETSWGNPKIFEAQFDDYKNAGFTAVRIPITWGLNFRTLSTPPYTVSETFLNRVEQVVDWALDRGFVVIINAHHEGWIKENFNETNLARFDSIWAQVSRRFKDKSDRLLFEIINEPYPMSLQNVNTLNAQILNTIRKTNPTRIVVFSGNMWSNADELISAAIPNNDTMLIGYYHSYDPYPFGLEGPGTFGSNSDIDAVNSRFLKVKKWSNDHNIPVILGEFGATKKCEYNSRMCHYATIVDLALTHHVPFFAWDDGGDFSIYQRYTRKWHEIKDILINTYPLSPNKVVIGKYADTLIQIQWNNRITPTDSIIIERKINDSEFTFYKKIAPTESRFVDQNVNTKNNYYYYRVKVKINDSTEAQSYPIRIQNTKITRSAYGGTPVNIPGTIEAENFDIGMEGDSYHDNDADNLGNKYRLGPGVDIFNVGSVYYIAHVDEEEWFEYTVKVKLFARYTVSAYVSSPEGGGKFSLFCKNDTISFDVQKTDTITNFVKLIQEIVLDTGIQVIRLKIDKTPEFGINKISFVVKEYLSVNDKKTSTIEIFPNPANNYIVINNISAPSIVNIYNCLGSLVKKINVNKEQQTINIADLPKGLYFIILNNDINVFKLEKK